MNIGQTLNDIVLSATMQQVSQPMLDDIRPKTMFIVVLPVHSSVAKILMNNQQVLI